jgi:hypothetical protein
MKDRKMKCSGAVCENDDHINKLLERLKECEDNLFHITQINSYTGQLHTVNGELVFFLKESYKDLAIEYFKKYEGKQ